MLGTNKKVVLKKLVFVTAMLIGVFGLTGCTVKDVVVDKSQKDQTNVSYYDCDQNKSMNKWSSSFNGQIRNESMCIPGIFLVKDVPEFKNLTVNDLKIIMDAPVVYTNGTVDSSDPRVVTFTSPGNDVYAFTQEGLNAYNATGNETIQFNYELKKGVLDMDKPFKIYSYFGIKKIILNNKEVENNENFRFLYDFDGSKINDIIFKLTNYGCYNNGKNTIKVIDFLDREKEVSVYFNTKESIYNKNCPKYDIKKFMGIKMISIYSSKSNIKYIKINGKKIKLKKNDINKKVYSYHYFKKSKRISFYKNTKKAVKIQIKYKNGYVFKYKL